MVTAESLPLMGGTWVSESRAHWKEALREEAAE